MIESLEFVEAQRHSIILIPNFTLAAAPRPLSSPRGQAFSSGEALTHAFTRASIKRSERIFLGYGGRELMPIDGSQFVILKKLSAVPSMGGCTVCGRKFFTPSNLLKDAVGAGKYLRIKFDSHHCSSRRDDWERIFQFWDLKHRR